MKTPRKSGWPWSLMRCLPDWVLRIRIAVLKRRSQTEDVKGEIADCEELLRFWAFRREVCEAYVRFWKEPYPEGPVWPIKAMPISVTSKTIVISSKEMNESYKKFKKRLKEIYKDFHL